GIVGAAVGTDTAGSIRIPAALNGVAGFKPTYGSISSAGIFPLSPSLDTPGFIGREVSTISALWEAISGQAAGVEGNGTNPRPVRFGVLPDSSSSGMASKVREGFAGVVGPLRARPHTVTETPPGE